MPNWVGQQLGNYRLIRLLGKGGFGQVYLGEHIYLKTYAAIKLVLEDVNGVLAEAFRTAFLQEAQRIAALKHPHILRVLDFGMETSTPYLVMEYAAHGTLLERHPHGSRVSLEQVVTYTKQIAQALHYAHKAGLIHRDVKPANVLLDERDTILLSDFGIATIVHHTSSMQTGGYAGTSAYMAPEQLQGKPVPASDQYALAIIVYEWLCSQLPYQGDPISVGMQHLMAPIPSLRLHNKMLSPTIEAVVHQAMAKDPRQRFATILDFAGALEQSHQGSPSTPATVLPPITLLSPHVQANTLPLTSPLQLVSIGQLQGEGEVFYAQELYEEALAAFQEILQIDLENARAYSWKGAALYQLKRYEEAFVAREQAIRKGDTSKETYQGKGEALYQLKRYKEAIAGFERAIQIDPNYAQAYSWKGATLYQFKRYEEAIVAREQAIRKGDTSKETYQGKGEALYQLKRYEEAIVAFDQCIQIYPYYATVYTWKAEALFYLVRYEEALMASSQAIQIDPNYAWAYGWKGAALYQLKRYEEALVAREQAIRKGEPNKENYQGKGEALYQLKRYKEAIAVFEQAIQIDPGYTDAYSWKAKALSQQRSS